LNINDHIKIKKILYQDQSMTRSFRGIACRANVIHKKMKSVIENPEILLLSGSLEYGNQRTELIEIDQVHKMENKYYSHVIKKLKKIKPSLILSSESVPMKIREYLLREEVSLVCKIDRQTIAKIAEITEAKPVTDITQLEKHKRKSFLGRCRRFSISNYQNKELYQMRVKNKKQRRNLDPSLMILEGCNNKGICILLSGPDYDQLEYVKRSLKLIFLMSKNLLLEKDILFLDKILYSYILEQIDPRKP
jgi:chaperonin GroEL (HSP60 family)